MEFSVLAAPGFPPRPFVADLSSLILKSVLLVLRKEPWREFFPSRMGAVFFSVEFGFLARSSNRSYWFFFLNKATLLVFSFAQFLST